MAFMISRNNPQYWPTLDYEIMLWKKGYRFVVGIDEAGRGAWAGPVCAAAVILPDDPSVLEVLNGVRDSKLLTPLARENLAPRIKKVALSWSVSYASAREIDKIGILPATKLAATRAVSTLLPYPDYMLTDFLTFPECEQPQTALIKGDRISLTIAAASILAKTSRDTIMVAMEQRYPGYSFSRHKGYGTLIHVEAIHKSGLCEIHRKSFSFAEGFMR